MKRKRASMSVSDFIKAYKLKREIMEFFVKYKKI